MAAEVLAVRGPLLGRRESTCTVRMRRTHEQRRIEVYAGASYTTSAQYEGQDSRIGDAIKMMGGGHVRKACTTAEAHVRARSENTHSVRTSGTRGERRVECWVVVPCAETVGAMLARVGSRETCRMQKTTDRKEDGCGEASVRYAQEEQLGCTMLPDVKRVRRRRPTWRA